MRGNEVNVLMLAKYDGVQGYKKKALWIAKKIGDGEQEARIYQLSYNQAGCTSSDKFSETDTLCCLW